jgi:hypothetical protein
MIFTSVKSGSSDPDNSLQPSWLADYVKIARSHVTMTLVDFELY